jgi:predicted O-linked N-acetylglucosamine transferase (SPINDLY family)
MTQATLLRAAIAHHQSGNLSEAESTYRQILHVDPQDAEALHWLGAIAYQRGEYDRALSHIRPALALQPQNPIFHNTAGMTYRALGDADAALTHYRSAIAIYPNRADLQRNFNNAWVDLLNTDRDRAIAHLVAVAEIYHRAGNVAQAEHLYQQVLQFEGDNADALHGLGTICCERENFERAIELLTQAIEANSQNANAHHNLGWAYQCQKQLESACASYRQALKLNLKHPTFQNSFGDAVLALVEVNPNTGKYELLLTAQNYHFSGHFAEAESLYRQILSRDANYVEALHGLGVVYHQTNRNDAAIAYLNRAIQLVPNQYTYYNSLGLVYQANSQSQTAIQTYRQGLELQPQHPTMQANLQIAIASMCEYYEEVAQFFYNAGNWEQAAQVDFHFGQFLKAQGQPWEVQIRYYRRAIAAAENFPEAYHALAEALLVQEKSDEAIAACTRAVQLKGDYALAYKTLGNAYLAKQDFDRALQAYDRALVHQPNFAEVCSNIGGVYLLQNKLDEAIAAYHKALSMDGNIAEIYWNLGKAYESQNKIAENIQCWQKALELKPEFGGAAARYQLGWKHYTGGQPEAAMVAYQAAIERQPDHVEANWDLCELLLTRDLAAARATADRFCQHVPDFRNVLAPLATIKSYLNSGVTEVALQKFLEFEPYVYEYLNDLNGRDTLRLFLNLFFDVPHLRDDVPANSKLNRALAERFRLLLRNKEQSENFRNRHYVVHSVRSPLRIGFISQHFRRHSVGWLSVEVIEHLSRITPHIYLYVTGGMTPDELTVRFKAVAEKFHHPEAIAANDITQEIIRDDLDVLVDLDSITVMVNAELMHRRPAPLCVSWLGFDAPYLSDKNYYIGDWYTHPAGVESYYVEQVARLPHTFAATSGLPIKPIDRALLRKSMRIAPNQVVYLCVATGNKYCREMVEAQIRILKQVPDSVLFYKARVGDLEAIGRIYRQECQRQGVRVNRVNLLPRTATEEEHRLIYQFADILIDSYPYSGATHVVEALWFDLPVVAKVSQQSFGRQAYSLMKNAGTDMGISWSWEEYIDWAVRLGLDVNLRQAMRSQLQQAKQPECLAPLWNPKQFASDFYGVLKDLMARQVVSG